MDPNSSPWAYAYNRIVPSAASSNEDFQHPHLASISAATGTSAQSLFLQAAHTSIAGFNATSGNFVPPSPIGGYNPVFQQIYHQAAQAAVQPKPAHYASSTVSTTHRHIGICGEKQDCCRSHTIGYQPNQTTNLTTTNYYGDNSSSSGASPSPTTSSTSATTLTWNAPAVDTSQQMTANAFISMQQQSDINSDEKVNNAKHSIPQTKGQSKIYGDLIYVGNDGQQPEQLTLHLDNQIVQNVSEGNDPRSENGFYTFVDGKLTYNIPAAAINSCLSSSNKLPVSSVKTSANTARKMSSGESQQPSTHQHCLNQISSPVYSIYESPSVCSSVGSPPQPIKRAHNSEGGINLGHNLYKSNSPSQTSVNNSNVGRGASSNNSSSSYTRNVVGSSSILSTTGVAYSSVITNAPQSQQQQLVRNQLSQEPDCWPSTTVKTIDTNRQNQRCYSVQSPPVQEGNIYALTSPLQVKHVLVEPNLENTNSSQLQQQIVHNALHVMSPNVEVGKHQSQAMQPQPRLINQSRQQSVENVLTASNPLASQIQCTTKVAEIQKVMTQKKTPRKRQPKKNLLINNELARSTQQVTGNNHAHQSQIQTHQTQQTMQLQQQNGSFFEYNNRWIPQKLESGESSQFLNSNHTNLTPQPAHLHPSSTHAHVSHVSQYFPTLPQVSTQYTCMTQNSNLYVTQPSTNGSQEQHNPQQTSDENHCSLQQRNTLLNVPEPPTTPVTTFKVIVPNIEDELNFLSDMDVKPSKNTFSYQDANNPKNTSQNQAAKCVDMYKPFENRSVTGKKSGFMDSYLKFLQGERDESPPPMLKSIRKFNYQRPVVQPSTQADKSKTNDVAPASVMKTNSNALNTPSDVSNSLNTPSNSESTANKPDDGHKIKILSQTQILPKKRPHVQNISTLQQTQLGSKEMSMAAAQEQQNSINIKQSRQELQQLKEHQDPLALPPRREQSLRRAKSQSVVELNPVTNDESNDFVDSDTDPVWTPEDDTDDSRALKCGTKRKVRHIRSPSKKKDNSEKNVNMVTHIDSTEKNAQIPARDKIISEVTNLTSPDNFKVSTTNKNVNIKCARKAKRFIYTKSTGVFSHSCYKQAKTEKVLREMKDLRRFAFQANKIVENTGDFIVLRSDLVNDWPIIWQVDSKCILQKYEPYCQNGKMFYRNMSKYASWNLDTKKLYLKAPVRIQIQSHAETIVEFMRSELLADDTEQFIEKMMEEYLTYRDHFEIYVQTMISQVLDPSFFSEISREKDEYFLSSIRTIDEIMENCKRKLLSITPWTRSVILSIETWPQCHVFTEWGQNNVNQTNCGGCHQPGISVRFLLFGHPYNSNTMQTIPVDMRVSYEKDILLCRICAARADIFHKIAHEKYNLFSICTSRVGDHQKENPDKTSTDILNDLLAENNWVDELFRNMRSSWAEVESLERQNRFREVSQ